MVDVDDDLVAMMSGGVLDVDTKMVYTRPYVAETETVKTANSKSQGKCQMVVAECVGGSRVSNAEVVVVVVVVDDEATIPK